MNATEYEKTHGVERSKLVVELAGTKWSYWRHMVNGVKRPGPDLARKLVKASERVTPETPLTLDKLLTPKELLKGRANVEQRAGA